MQCLEIQQKTRHNPPGSKFKISKEEGQLVFEAWKVRLHENGGDKSEIIAATLPRKGEKI